MLPPFPDCYSRHITIWRSEYTCTMTSHCVLPSLFDVSSLIRGKLGSWGLPPPPVACFLSASARKVTRIALQACKMQSQRFLITAISVAIPTLIQIAFFSAIRSNRRFSRELLYTLPPLTPFLAQRAFFRQGGVYILKSPGQEFYNPPPPSFFREVEG